MLNKVMAWVAKMAVGKKILEWVHLVNTAATGKRTEILISLEVLLWGLKYVGVLDGSVGEAAETLRLLVLGAIPVTAAEKIKNSQSFLEKITPNK